ncbi:MAG: peptidoglycan DD-metalloendopeptidase family protein [Nitrospirota bacterium]
MSTKTDKYLGILVIFAILVANTTMSFAEGESINVEEEIVPVTEDFEDEKVDRGIEDKAEEQELFLSRLKEELNLTKAGYRQIMNTVSDTDAKLNELSENKMTLSEQIEVLDNSIVLTQSKLIDVIKNIVEKENEVILLYEQIEIKEIAIGYQKELIGDYVRIIYQEENNYFSIDENGGIQAFKLLLADDSVGNNLKKIEYFDLLNEAGQQMIEELSSLSEELLIHQKELEKKKAKLQGLQVELETEKQQLELQKASKENLLALTKGQEDIYQQLLEQTLMEQEELLSDVKNLGNAVAFIEKKIEEEGADFDPDDYLSLLDYKTQVLYDYRYRSGPVNPDGFNWPAQPDRGLSAYFHDPTYVGAFGVQHNAIDIPIYQGSFVRAAAEGVVYTTRDNGYGYSYVILAHAGGFMTVYGHISSILVEEGDLINQGAIIGLSGGMPGTKGAGYMTTGPHLHFEVLSNGLYADPLDYLPLEILTEDQISILPEKYFDDWEEAVYDLNFEAIERF